MTVLAELARRADAGEPAALATVIETIGSSPAQAAMRMLVDGGGRVAGTVGGGRVEATVERRAGEVLRTGRPQILGFTLDDELADEGGLLCGGTVRILVERVAPPAPWAARAATLLRSGRRAALLARIGDKEISRELVEGEAAAPWAELQEPALEGDLFVEPIFVPRCLVLGAGHVGRRVARIAREAGFFVVVAEDRPEQAERAEADEVVCADLEEALARLEPQRDDYIVIMTRAHGLDLRCLRAALASPARYVGMLASRKKAATLSEIVRKEGVDVERLHAPVGLDLAAKSAGEIAVSVVAQLIKVRRLGRGDR